VKLLFGVVKQNSEKKEAMAEYIYEITEDGLKEIIQSDMSRGGATSGFLTSNKGMADT
jgi:hypothetical protein